MTRKRIGLFGIFFFEFRICFEFRHSDFEFSGPLDVVQAGSILAVCRSGDFAGGDIGQRGREAGLETVAVIVHGGDRSFLRRMVVATSGQAAVKWFGFQEVDFALTIILRARNASGFCLSFRAAECRGVKVFQN
jgi:hypothetical protein